MWTDWLRERPYASRLTFAPGADRDELADVERALGEPLPEDLHALLCESNGISGEFGLGVVWPAARIAADNLRFRSDFKSLYRSFDGLLFFADAGNGDHFAFAKGGKSTRVIAWDHETDDRREWATDLRAYLDGWLSGSLKV